MRKVMSFLVVVLAMVGWCLGGEAQAGGPYPSVGGAWSGGGDGSKDVALVVAVEDYFRLPSVPGARETGRDWEQFFREGLGVGRVYGLVDEEVTREALERFAKQAAEDVEAGGTLWFVFVGHGAPAGDGTDGLLLGVDAQQTAESLSARSMAQREVLELLEAGPQARTVAFVDACFSGRDSEGESLVPNLQPVVPVEQVAPVRAGSVVLSAARSNEYAGAMPGLDRPAFSYWMLGALRGWAAPGGGEGRSVSAGAALAFTREKLRAIQGRVQTPVGTGDLDLVLVHHAQEEDPLPNWNGRVPELKGAVESKESTGDQPLGHGLVVGARRTKPREFVVSHLGDWSVEDRESGERFVGAGIYRMLGEEELARDFERAARRRAVGVQHSQMTSWGGLGLAMVGVAAVVGGSKLRLPESHSALGECAFSEFPMREENCIAQRSFDTLKAVRVGGWVALGVGSAAFVVGQVLKRVAVNRPVHPRTPQELDRMLKDRSKKLSLELSPYFFPGQDSQAGVTVGMQW